MDIKKLQKLVVKHRNLWGFGKETPEQLALGLCIESGEFAQTIMREYRYGKPRGGLDDKSSLPNEAADVMVFLLAAYEACGVDIVEALKHKIKMNDARFIKPKLSKERT